MLFARLFQSHPNQRLLPLNFYRCCVSFIRPYLVNTGAAYELQRGYERKADELIACALINPLPFEPILAIHSSRRTNHMNWFRFKLSEETPRDTLQVGFELLFAVLFIFCIASIDSIVEAFF